MTTKFIIKLIYFKDNGKYYTDKSFEHNFSSIGLNSVNMYDVIYYVKNSLFKKNLPGLTS